jgi:hypothetical protein
MTAARSAAAELAHPFHLWWVWVHVSSPAVRQQAEGAARLWLLELLDEGAEGVRESRDALRRGSWTGPTQARELLLRRTNELQLGLDILVADEACQTLLHGRRRSNGRSNGRSKR